MRKLDAYRCAILDCDGVILDSNDAKTRAFRETLAGESPEHVEAFVREHRRTGGVSRYVKLERFYRDVRRDPDWRAATDAALARFGACSRQALLECPLVPGIERLLGELARRGIPARVVSGGDEREVREVLAARGLAELFADILGSPRSKPDHLAALRDAGRLPTPGLYLGDAHSDLEAAEGHALDFVFVSGFTDWTAGAAEARARGHRVVRDPGELIAAS